MSLRAAAAMMSGDGDTACSSGGENGTSGGVSGAGVTKLDYAWYQTTGDASASAPNSTGATKVPMRSFNAVAGARYYGTTAGGGYVFCLSCHYAHGGPNFDALRWSHASSVSAGNQVGVGVASNVGCQQCHNR